MYHVSSLHITSLHLHSTPTWIPLLVTTFLTLFLKVFSLQGKDASKPAGNWFQLLMAKSWAYCPAVLRSALTTYQVRHQRITGLLTDSTPNWQGQNKKGKRHGNSTWTFTLKSCMHRAQETGTLKANAWATTSFLNPEPHKAIIVQFLQPCDSNSCSRYCQNTTANLIQSLHFSDDTLLPSIDEHKIPDTSAK
jgi:hypothetical protein